MWIRSIWVGALSLLLFQASLLWAATSDLRKDGNAYPRHIETKSGPQFFVANQAFFGGANQTKIFGKHRPTTFWSDKRRARCYELSLRLMAQMPLATGVETEEKVQTTLQHFGLSVEVIENIANALNALHTNYVDGSTLSGKISNQISKALRGLNQKSFGGVKVPCTNLKHLGQLMETIGYGYTAADFAIGAAVQEALAGDLALGRLNSIREILLARQRAGRQVDPAIWQAVRQAEKNLVRSTDYWGALITELTDRRRELAKISLKVGVKLVRKVPVKLLTRYYSKSMGAKAAATKASSVAGLWAFSLIATYQTIDALLDQHKKAQIAVTSATMATIISEEIVKKQAQVVPVIRAVQHQAEYSYYDQMVQISSGFLPAYRDFIDNLLSGEQHYKDAREYFAKIRDEIKSIILNQPSQDTAEIRQTIIAIADSSGSMTKTDPRDLRIAALKMMLDSLGPSTALGLVDFDSRPRVLSKPVRLGPFSGPTRKTVRTALTQIDSQGGTDIRGGLEAGVQLAQSGSGNVVMVLLTDGKDESKSGWTGQAGLIPQGIPVHTIALSDQADRQSLALISAATGGIPEIARNAEDLHRIIGLLFGMAEGDEVCLLREGTIQNGERIEYRVPIQTEALLTEFRVTWPGSDIDITAVDPAGNTYTIAQAVKQGFGIEEETYDIIRIKNPTPGEWTLILEGVLIDPGGEPYSVRVADKESRLPTDWIISAPVPEVGAPFSVAIQTEQEILWEEAAVQRWMPDGRQETHAVALGGVSVVSGIESAQTVYEEFIEEPGIHRIQINLSGNTPDGLKVSRALDRTFRVEESGQGVDWKIGR